MKRGITTLSEAILHKLLNAPHNPKNDKIPPGWENEDMTHDHFRMMMDDAIAYRKAHGMIPAN